MDARYAILDYARDPLIGQLVGSMKLRTAPLLQGGGEVVNVGPHLVRVGRSMTQVLNEAFGRSWGIFIQSSAAPRDLVEHLRSLLTVESGSANATHFFRYYDPRVWLSTQCMDVPYLYGHGAISTVWVENRDEIDRVRWGTQWGAEGEMVKYIYDTTSTDDPVVETTLKMTARRGGVTGTASGWIPGAGPILAAGAPTPADTLKLAARVGIAFCAGVPTSIAPQKQGLWSLEDSDQVLHPDV